MTRNDDFIRQLEGYLEEYEGSTPLPGAVRDAIRAELPLTHQRPAWWPERRFPEMNNVMKLGLSAAAVVIAALLGYNYLVAPNIGAPGLDDSAPTATPAATLAPVAGEGQLDAGTYRIIAFTRSPFTVTVPDGWRHENEFISRGEGTVEANAFEDDGVYMATWTVTHVYGDSCGWEGTLREARTFDALIAALTEQTGHETSGPTETELGGRPATRFDFSVPSSFDISACDQEFLRLWPDAGPDENFGLPIAVGQTATVYVLDFESGPMLVISGRKEASSAGDVAELDAVVDSIRFEAP